MEIGRRDPNGLHFVLITVAGNAVGIGIILPILPDLLVELTGESLSQVALYGGWLTALFSVAQFVAAPLLGSLSDRFGRKPVLLCSLVAVSVNYLITGLAPTLAWLFAARVLGGACSGTISAAGAYVADVTEPGNRARQFGMLSAAFSGGLVLGPVLGGVLGEYGTRVPFIAAAGFSLLNALCGLVVLPESLAAANRQPFSLERSNPLHVLRQMRRQRELIAQFGALGMMQIASVSVPIMWAYVTAQKFGWSQSRVGITLGLYGLTTAAAQGILTGYVNRWLGSARTVCISSAFMIFGLTGYACAGDSSLMLAFTLPTALGAIAKPSLLSILTRRTPAAAQGELHGAISSVTSVAAVITPVMMTHVFRHFSDAAATPYFPGAPFALAALFATFALLFAIRVLQQSHSGPECNSSR